MFDIEALPTTGDIAGSDDSGLIETVGAAQRLERAATARRLFAVAELFMRREAGQPADERHQWRIDGWDAVAAEVAAAQGISRHRASSQIQLAVCLREELPKVAEVFAAGLVDYWVVATIVSRIGLLKPEDKARIDAVLARRVKSWNRLSRKKVVDMIDSWVTQIDYLAQRPKRSADEDRHIGFGPDKEGMAEVWGSVRAPVAAALEASLDALADTVCKADPRTREQLRADAVGALAANQDRMQCCCGQVDCPAGDVQAAPVVIHVVADAATVYGRAGIPGYLPGYGALPAELVRSYVRTAKLCRVALPSDLADCEKAYRPSAALATYVRLRDLTCRFPGCDAAAEVCDLDHTVPWPYGPTHASNLKLLCRHHHLLKTFYTGHSGWADVQMPDGTVVWTSPTGHEYTTKPGGALFFPQLAKPTGKLLLPKDIPRTGSGRGLMMPTRDRTRAQERQARIDYERGLNYKRLIRDADPPPF
jgi:Domain of unknown function (DUF222)